jgi:hypothetical protein
MESSRQAASDALRETVARVEKLNARMDEPLTLHAVTPHFQVLQTTFAREVREILLFCFCLLEIDVLVV